MAKISLNSTAPKDENVHFSFGGTDFDLKGTDAVYETEDPALIAAAGDHAWLVARVEAPKETSEYAVDLADPHFNPTIDHLASEASPETIEKANAEADRIRAEVSLDEQPQPEAPVVEEPKQPSAPTPTPEVTA